MKHTLTLLALCVTSYLFAQSDSTFYYPINQTENTFSGEGVDWILNQKDSVQFVLFGEQHYVDGVAEFATFIYNELQPSGFNRLILETDTWTASRSSTLGVDPFTSNNPHSIAFDSDGDLALMQAAIDANPSLQDQIWGMDQMITAIHPFKRLTELGETSRQRRLARGAHFKTVVQMGRYLRWTNFEDIKVLKSIFADLDSPEKDQILNEISASMEIYTTWMNKETRQASVAMRESYMKHNFDNYFTSPNLKGVLKMGGAHTLYGIGPNGVPTLGNHINKRVNEAGSKVLNISIYRYDPEKSFLDSSAFDQSNMVLVDTKAFTSFDPETSFNSDLGKRDAIILIKDTGFAPKIINRTYEKDFRNGFIKQILPLGICVILCLVSIIAMIINLIRKRDSLVKKSHAFLGTFSIVLIGIIVYQILQIRGYPASLASITEPGLLSIHLFLFLISAFLLLRTVGMLTKQLGSKGLRRYSLIMSLNVTVLSYLIFYWNIGGMLG